MRDTLGLKTAWGGPARKHTLGKTRGPSCAQTAGGEDELWQGRLAFLQTTHVWAPPPPRHVRQPRLLSVPRCPYVLSLI